MLVWALNLTTPTINRDLEEVCGKMIFARRKSMGKERDNKSQVLILFADPFAQ
jgi:hypothetical protein